MNKSFSPGPHPVTLGSSERAEDKKACSDANTGVCDVERWPRVFVHVEMKKIGAFEIAAAVEQARRRDVPQVD